MLTPSSRNPKGAVASLVFAGGMLLSACASGTSPETNNVAAEGSSDAIVAEAKANVDEWFANSSAPVNTEGLLKNNLRDKKIFYLNGYLTSPSGTAGLEGLEQAQKALGFELKTFDGEFSPAKYQEGLRQALSGKYDGVILYGIDCPGNEQPLKDLKAAKIPVASISGADCDATDPSAAPLFTSDVQYPLGDGKTGDSVDMYKAWGASQADYVIAKSDGTAKVLLLELPDFFVLKAEADGFRERIAECGGCTLLDTVPVLAADLGGPSLAEKADQALIKHPDATAVVAPYDDVLMLGVANSVVQSGRAENLLVVGGTGLPAAADLIRKDKGVNGGWGYDYAWDHYAALAALMSAIEGQPAPVVGTPLIWYDEENNLPATGGWKPDVDFQAAFEKAWTSE